MATRRIRSADPRDVPAIRAILAAHDEDEPGVEPDIIGPYLHHLITRHRALVTIEGDTVFGYGATVETGLSTHLADLFVHPDHLGVGIGRPLLDALFGDASRRTTFASRDPRALPVYVRAGMLPTWMNLYLAGDVSALPPVEPGLSVTPADASVMASTEQAWTGADRRIDHEFWASGSGGDAFLVQDEHGPVALGHARTAAGSHGRALTRLAIRPDADPVAPVVAALRRAGAGSRVSVTVPGPNPALPVLLEHGFRIEDHDQAMASAADLVDPLHLLPNPAML